MFLGALPQCSGCLSYGRSVPQMRSDVGSTQSVDLLQDAGVYLSRTLRCGQRYYTCNRSGSYAR
ncbi:MAG: hypothetical protein QOI97_4573 [Pseudomonas sp.]|nr:hypothetical protein [Pseudomonas sp.]